MNIINRLDDNKISSKEDLMKSINRDFNKANKEDSKKIQDYKIQQMVDKSVGGNYLFFNIFHFLHFYFIFLS